MVNLDWRAVVPFPMEGQERSWNQCSSGACHVGMRREPISRYARRAILQQRQARRS